MSQTEDNTGANWRRCDAIALTALVAVLIFFYWGFLSGKSFIWDDTLTELYPGINYFARSIHAGRFPLWFPGIHDGQPFYSDPQLTVFYPLQWLLIPFVQDGRLPAIVYQTYIVLHYLLGGFFLYAFLKQRKLHPMAALSGAFVFCLSGFASLHIVNFVMIQTYIWLPLQLLFVDRVITKRNRWDWLGLVGAMLLSLLAGHQQTTVYCWYLVIAYWLYRSWSQSRKAGANAKPAMAKDLARMVGTFVLVLGLCACLWIPAAQNWSLTERPSQSFDYIADTSLPPRNLLTMVAPNFFGITKAEDSPLPFWGYDPHSLSVKRNGPVNAKPGYWQYWEFGIYTGQIFWLGLLLLLFNWRLLDDKRTTGFFLFAWLIAMWFVLGRYGGLFQVLYHVLPGASFFRGPAKMACVSSFAAAVITGYAIDLAARKPQELRWRPVLAIVTLFAAVMLAVIHGAPSLIDGLQNHQGRWMWSVYEVIRVEVIGIIGVLMILCAAWFTRDSLRNLCLALLLMACVADFHHAYGDFQKNSVSPDTYFPRTDKLLPLLQDYRENRGPFRFGQTNRGKVSEEIAMFRNLAFFHDFLEVPEGYASFFLDDVKKFQETTNEEAKIAIQNIVVSMDRDATGKDFLGTRKDSFPRAKFFARARRFESRDAVLTALQNGDLDWRHEAAVTEPGFPSFTGSENSDDQVQFESVSPETYTLSYHVNQPGIIFISQAWYPGWHETSGRYQVVKVFGAFQGIVIPEAGEGRVIVQFSPTPLKAGIAISLVSLLAVILLIRRQGVFPSLPRSGESLPSTDRTASV